MTEENTPTPEHSSQEGENKSGDRPRRNRHANARWKRSKRPRKKIKKAEATDGQPVAGDADTGVTPAPVQAVPAPQSIQPQGDGAQSGEGQKRPTRSMRASGKPNRYRSSRRKPYGRPANSAYPAIDDAVARQEFDFTTALLATEQTMAEKFTGGLDLKGLKFPGIDSTVLKNHLVRQIQDQFEQSGRDKVVLGLSGGLDSSVAACLLVAALGRERVHLIHFIELEKSGSIRTRADVIARMLQCHLDMVDLRPVLNAVFASRPQVEPTARKIRIARERMAALFDWAESKHACVAGCLNKTKLCLGFGTSHGDAAYALNPLGDVYQSQVLELARFLNVPQEVLDRATRSYTAERIWDKNVENLWKQLDFYLYQIMDVRISLSHLHRLGLNEAKLNWVYQRIRESALQRQVPPVIESVSTYVPRTGEL